MKLTDQAINSYMFYNDCTLDEAKEHLITLARYFRDTYWNWNRVYEEDNNILEIKFWTIVSYKLKRKVDYRDKRIVLTDHCIEEYKNDNPLSQIRPDIHLRYIFNKLIHKRINKKLDQWDFRGEVHKMRYKNEVIIFKEEDEYFLIITYYKYINDELRKKLEKIYKRTKSKLNSVMSWKKERMLENKQIRKENREKRKYAVGKFKKMTKLNLKHNFCR